MLLGPRQGGPSAPQAGTDGACAQLLPEPALPRPILEVDVEIEIRDTAAQLGWLSAGLGIVLLITHYALEGHGH